MKCKKLKNSEEKRMTKKKYYELLGEYEQLATQKEFNPNFCDNERFHEVQKKVIFILCSYLLDREMDLEPYMLSEKDLKMKKLLEKITSGKTISKEDYKGTNPYGMDVDLLFDLTALFILFGILAIELL